MGCASSAVAAPGPNNTGSSSASGAPAGSRGGAGGSGPPPRTATAPSSIGNSIPLASPQRWTSKRKINKQMLEKKREEFWHTAQATNVPAVWQQLRTVCDVMTGGDLATANAICQAAGIITPEGSLTQCYDQFGNLYEIPHYCICDPINLVTGAPGSFKREGVTERSRGDSGPEMTVRVRLYVDEIELKVDTHENENIDVFKEQIQKATQTYTEGDSHNAGHEDLPVEPERMRLFAHGREIKDTETLSWVGVTTAHVVQVMVRARGGQRK
jgi:hypothetical protein